MLLLGIEATSSMGLPAAPGHTPGQRLAQALAAATNCARRCQQLHLPHRPPLRRPQEWLHYMQESHIDDNNTEGNNIDNEMAESVVLVRRKDAMTVL